MPFGKQGGPKPAEMLHDGRFGGSGLQAMGNGIPWKRDSSKGALILNAEKQLLGHARSFDIVSSNLDGKRAEKKTYYSIE